MRIAEIEGHPMIDKLKAAFAGTSYPGDEVIPGRPDSVDEAPEEFRQLRSRQWADLEIEAIPSLSPVLMWLSPEGLSYYLPAFLAAAIFSPASAGSLDIIGFLAPPASRGRDWRGLAGRGHFRRLIEALTPDQKRVVGECLQHLRVNMDGVYSFWSPK